VTPKTMEMTARTCIRAIFVRSHLPSTLFTASSVRRGPPAWAGNFAGRRGTGIFAS
jgi:hypothetical protein